MRYFLDTEFNEDGRTIDLISIALVAEDGREFYAISNDFDAGACNDFVQQNVLPQLSKDPTRWHGRATIKRDLIAFVGDDTDVSFWGYYADYDWVALCQLMGTMMDLPKNFPMYCRDIKQWCDQLGNPKLPEQTSVEHNALADARWNREAWTFLGEYTDDALYRSLAYRMGAGEEYEPPEPLIHSR